MTDICLGFEAHQPFRLNKDFSKNDTAGKDIEDIFDIYFDNSLNRDILDRVSEKCYLPANEKILENIEKYEEDNRSFKVAYSISGVLAYQLEKWRPDVLDSFVELAENDCVEFLGQTFYHSLASLFSEEKEEFIEQVLMHRNLMKDIFGREPKIFENTEFIYNNSIASVLDDLGYEGVFTEGAERILGWRSPNYVYEATGSDIRILLRNYRLSDDIAFRFSNRKWPGWPLTADKYADWLSRIPGQCVNIFMDYETFGEHQWPETGIFDFLDWLPREVLKRENLEFVKPSELIEYEPVGEIDVGVYNTLSWADIKKSDYAWLGNSMQRSTYQRVKELQSEVKKVGDDRLLELWRLFQISDHYYYMYTAPGSPQEVHNYFSQQKPIEAFNRFNKILSDFENILKEELEAKS